MVRTPHHLPQNPRATLLSLGGGVGVPQHAMPGAAVGRRLQSAEVLATLSPRGLANVVWAYATLNVRQPEVARGRSVSCRALPPRGSFSVWRTPQGEGVSARARQGLDGSMARVVPANVWEWLAGWGGLGPDTPGKPGYRLQRKVPQFLKLPSEGLGGGTGTGSGTVIFRAGAGGDPPFPQWLLCVWPKYKGNGEFGLIFFFLLG